VRTRYTYLGDTTIEIVVDGETIDVNLLPAEPSPAPDPGPAVDESAPLAAPLQLTAATYTKKRRGLMGLIRTGWFYLFTVLGAAVDYGIAKLTDWGLPPGTATLIGGALYGLKRAFWPDTTL
jgi:hypothetical protein